MLPLKVMPAAHLARKRLLGAVLAVLAVAVWNPPGRALAQEARQSPIGSRSTSMDAAQADEAPTCTPRSQCCKVCHKGKACGNTCIRADYNCHKGAGCACDAEDVCD